MDKDKIIEMLKRENGSLKEQIEFSEMMVGIGLIGMMVVMLIGFIMSVIV